MSVRITLKELNEKQLTAKTQTAQGYKGTQASLHHSRLCEQNSRLS